MSPGWLCPTEVDRQRAVDTSARVRRARLLGSAFAGVGVLVLAPILSWWLLGLFAISTLNMVTLDRRMARSERPELHAAASMAFTEAILATAAVITGGPHSPLLPMLVLPVGMMPARFRGRVVAVGAAVGALTIVGVGAAVDATALIQDPGLTIVTLALLGNVVAIAMAIQGAELEHRSESVLDPLTGLLNRKALGTRFAELEEQARLSGAPVCVIASLVVLPRVDLQEGLRVAERLREVVERTCPGGVDVTASLGVAVARGDGIEYERLFAAADEALYAAKREGRNRVAAPPQRREARAPKPSAPQPAPA